MPFPLAKKRTLLFTVPLREWHAEKMKMLNKWLSPNGGIAWVYRLVLPTGRRGPFHNVLLLSRYLALRERFPYLTHSCKSELNSSNSENELQTCLLSIWTRGSCQGWGRLRDHPSDLLASSPLKTAAAPQHTPCARNSCFSKVCRTQSYTMCGKQLNRLLVNSLLTWFKWNTGERKKQYFSWMCRKWIQTSVKSILHSFFSTPIGWYQVNNLGPTFSLFSVMTTVITLPTVLIIITGATQPNNNWSCALDPSLNLSVGLVTLVYLISFCEASCASQKHHY